MTIFDDLIKITEKEEVPKTYVAIVFDQSGSMDSLKNEIVDGLNEEIEAIKESSKDQEVKLSLTFFDSKVSNPLYWNLDIEDFQRLKKEEYTPSGMTALYDAIGITIDRLLEEHDINDERVSVLLKIVTDGLENASKLFTSAKIFSKIDELQKLGNWTFSYLGTGDLTKINQNLGIDIGNIACFKGTAEGIRENTVYTCSSYNHYFNERKIGTKSVKNFYEGTITTGNEGTICQAESSQKKKEE